MGHTHLSMTNPPPPPGKPANPWREKLAAYKGLPKVQPIPERMRGRHGEGTIAIPSPQEVDAAIRLLPERSLATLEQLASHVARQHGATIGCTVTTSIFAALVAKAADADERAGASTVTPYWRAIRNNGELNPKYPGGIDNLMARLEAEGHVVVQRGKRFFVEHYRRKLANL